MRTVPGDAACSSRAAVFTVGPVTYSSAEPRSLAMASPDSTPLRIATVLP